MNYIVFNEYAKVTEAAYDAARGCCKGSYQLDLLDGRTRMSGADLKGKARHWGGKYARSRANLLDRLTEHPDLHVEVRRQHHGRLCLVVMTVDEYHGKE